MNKLITMMVALVAVSLSVWAETWYVDAAAAAGGDGTAAHPFATIQAAIDAAAANDSISVAAGVYASGSTTVGGCATRVAIVDKAGLKITGAGRGKTIVKGAYGTTLRNCGDGAVRCVTVKNSDGTILSKMSLVGGATTGMTSPSGSANEAGGFFADSTDVYLVDAEVRECWALQAASSYRGTIVRTLIAGGRVINETGNGFTAGCLGTRLIHSIVTRCQCSGNAGLLTNGSAYNTTFSDNYAAWTINGSSASVEAYNVICVNTANGDDLKNSVTSSGCVLKTAPHGVYQFLAPAKGDYRLLDTSDAINAGDAANLANLNLPEGLDAYKDYLGSTIPSTGTINAGAIQTTVSPSCGGLAFVRDNNSTIPAFTVDGVRFPKDTYLYADSVTEQHVVICEPAAGYWFNRAIRTSDSTPIYSDLQDRLVLMPNPASGRLETNTFQHAGAVIWVDRESGSDETGTGTTNAPFASLQKAVDSVSAASTRALVMVQKGVYDNGASTNATYGIFRVNTQSKQIHFRSVEGPEKTILVGAKDPETRAAADFPGCGANAVHGALLTSPGTGSTCLQGFTITGCCSGPADNTDKRASSAFYSRNASVVADCIISNNLSAYRLTTEGVLMRDKIIDNVASNFLCNSAVAASSSFFSNNRVRDRSAAVNGVIGGNIYHCTLFTDEVKSGRLNAGGTVFDSIYCGGNAIYSSTAGCGNLYWNVASISGSSTYLNADPLFVDSANGGALASDSPAIGAGDAPTASNAGATYYKYSSASLDGKLFTYDANGKSTIGAFETSVAVARITVAEPEKGGYALGGERAWGAQVIAEGESLVFTAASGTRPCTGVKLGETEYLFGEADEIQIPYADLAAAGSGASVVGLYTTDWYLDVTKSNDETGFRPNHGKKTFAAIIPLMASGDTLHVLPGTYAEGEMVQNDARAVKSRVVIPKGVSIVSTEGAASTTIAGGENIRCAYMASGTTLQGFTLRDGQTKTSADEIEDKQGGAVLGDSVSGRAPSYGIVVADSIVTNCSAAHGSAGARCQFVNCRIVGNASPAGGSIFYQVGLYGCLITGNTATHGILYSANVMNTTFDATNKQEDGKTRTLGFEQPAYSPLAAGAIWNSVFACKVDTGNGKIDIRNSVFPDNSTTNLTAGYEIRNVQMVDVATLSFEANGAPTIGTNPAVDFGDASLEIPYLDATKDLNGGPRVMNGEMDVGAVEANWLSRYTALYSPKGIASVTAADPQVVAGESRVKILSGTLTAVWPKRDKVVSNVFRAQVLGTGTLTVKANGETIATVVSADGDTAVSFPPSADGDTVTMTYVPGDGDTLGALVGAAVTKRGFLLIVR